MLLEIVLSPLFMLIGAILDVIPSTFVQPDVDITDFITFMKVGFAVFPYDLFQVIVANVLFWLELQMVWAIVEWCYKKIPGIG